MMVTYLLYVETQLWIPCPVHRVVKSCHVYHLRLYRLAFWLNQRFEGRASCHDKTIECSMQTETGAEKNTKFGCMLEEVEHDRQ